MDLFGMIMKGQLRGNDSSVMEIFTPLLTFNSKDTEFSTAFHCGRTEGTPGHQQPQEHNLFLKHKDGFVVILSSYP